MEIVTSWMEQGIERGIEQGIERGIERGIEQGELKLVLKQLARRLQRLAPGLEAQVRQLPIGDLESLGEALLDFSGEADLGAWLAQRS